MPYIDSMCGIGAVFGTNIIDGESIIRKSLEAVKGRGHSLFEITASDRCVLGANRLEIVDRQNARQPQTNEDETVFVVFNGEIFNHKALRAGLLEKGHRFRTESDTEVLAHLYEEHGAGMVEKLDSEMFAFFIYDKRNNSFFASRDPYGVKPLYYAFDNRGNTHFASEIKQLAQFCEIDEVRHFLPGHYMHNRELRRYHRIPRPHEKTDDGLSQTLQNLRRLFDESVKKRVDTDLPIGVFFSGGVDSSSVLATARKYHKDVTAITVGHPDSPDRITAKRYCDENGIRQISRDMPDEEVLAEFLPKIIHITESFEPHVIRYASVAYYISETARKNGLRVVLSGDGAEELFAGYDVFERFNKPEKISQRIYEFVSYLSRTQFQRVDRMSMFHGVEVRLPLFDTSFADYALRIPGGLKRKIENGKSVDKWIWREAMKDRLPGYITGRRKAVLSEGAGYRINEQSGGPLLDIANEKISDEVFKEMKREFSGWNLHNKESAYNFAIYAKNLYTKATFNKRRPYNTHRSHIGWKISSFVSKLFDYDSAIS